MLRRCGDTHQLVQAAALDRAAGAQSEDLLVLPDGSVPVTHTFEERAQQGMGGGRGGVEGDRLLAGVNGALKLPLFAQAEGVFEKPPGSFLRREHLRLVGAL
jgi:hypothetical protein